MSLPHCLLRFVPNSQTLVKTQEPQQPYSKIIMTCPWPSALPCSWRMTMVCEEASLAAKIQASRWMHCLAVFARMDTQAEIKVRMRNRRTERSETSCSKMPQALLHFQLQFEIIGIQVLFQKVCAQHLAAQMSLNQLAENKNEKKVDQLSSFSICRVRSLAWD